MDWLRLRERAVEVSLAAEHPTDARRAPDGVGGVEPDPEAERLRRLRHRFVLFFLYALFVSGSVGALFGNGGLVDLLRLHGDLGKANQALADERSEIAALREEVAQLEDDDLARERIAREELGLARPGEITFVLPWQQGNDRDGAADGAAPDDPGASGDEAGRTEATPTPAP